MSLGEGGFANLVLQDGKTFIYEYGGFNLNVDKYKNECRIADGIITIQRSCFVEPEIHEKLKRMPSGRKRLVTKRIPVYVDYGQMIYDGLITIENCSNCWKTTSGGRTIDYTALDILYELFHEYQEQGEIPVRVFFFK